MAKGAFINVRIKTHKPDFDHEKAVRIFIVIVVQFSKDYLLKQNGTDFVTKIELTRTSLNCEELINDVVFFLLAFQELSVVIFAGLFPLWIVRPIVNTYHI